jgi:hypothetical protein
VGDVARIGSNPPPVAITYRKEDGYFVPPLSYNLVTLRSALPVLWSSLYYMMVSGQELGYVDTLS